jgi:hypothetical protein
VVNHVEPEPSKDQGRDSKAKPRLALEITYNFLRRRPRGVSSIGKSYEDVVFNISGKRIG